MPMLSSIVILDACGAATSLTATYFFVKLNRKAWWISLLAIAINCCLYAIKGIYADMLLEGFYFISCCYGLISWRKKYGDQVIRTLSIKHAFLLLISLLSLFTLLKLGLLQFTNSTVANLDAFTTAMSLIAQLLMCYKVIFTWVLWLITDATYAYLYFHKDLPLHGLLMIIYTGMAVIGYYSWQQKQCSTAPLALSNNTLS